MKRVTPENKDLLTPAEAIDHFVLSRRKFTNWLKNETSPFLIARHGKRKLINRTAFEKYLSKHPELRRREKWA